MRPGAARKLGRPPKTGGPSSRSLILEAALELFSTQGYDSTSVKEIAAKVGFRDAAIYGHFTGKEAIRAELFSIHGPNAVRLEWAALNFTGAWNDPQAFVKAQLHRLAERWLDRREQQFFRFMIMENLRADAAPPVVIGELQTLVHTALTRVAEKLMNDGILRRLDAAWLAEQFIAPITGLRINVAFNQPDLPLAALCQRLDHHVDMYFQAFGTRERR